MHPFIRGSKSSAALKDRINECYMIKLKNALKTSIPAGMALPPIIGDLLAEDQQNGNNGDNNDDSDGGAEDLGTIVPTRTMKKEKPAPQPALIDDSEGKTLPLYPLPPHKKNTCVPEILKPAFFLSSQDIFSTSIRTEDSPQGLLLFLDSLLLISLSLDRLYPGSRRLLYNCAR